VTLLAKPFSPTDGLGWTTLEDDKVLKDYASEIITFLKTIVLTVDKPDGYTFPMREEEKDMARKFAAAVTEDKKDIDLLHNLFYSFTAPPDEGTPIGKWQDAFLTFICASNLRICGTFEPVRTVTKQLAKWEYLIRGSCLHEFSGHDLSIREMER
jgi:hypothetical protein